MWRRCPKSLNMEIEKLKLLPLTDLDSLMQWRAEVLSHVFGHEPGAELLAENRRYTPRTLPPGFISLLRRCMTVRGLDAVPSVCRMSCRRPTTPTAAVPS